MWQNYSLCLKQRWYRVLAADAGIKLQSGSMTKQAYTTRSTCTMNSISAIKSLMFHHHMLIENTFT